MKLFKKNKKGNAIIMALVGIIPLVILYIFLGSSALALVLQNGQLIAICVGVLLFVWILRKVM